MKRMILILLFCLLALPAQASRVIHLDFSNWSLETIFPTINGNTPPTATDVELVKEAILWEVTRNFAPFDVYVTEETPLFGPRSLVRFLSNASASGALGVSGTNNGDCSDCTGIDSWESFATISEVFVGGFVGQPVLSGANATTTRIARALAHSASHELGHNLGLFHCNAFDDFFANNIGTTDATCIPLGADPNATSHVMSSGPTGLTWTQRATVNDFFSIHSSRRVLLSNIQPRGHGGRLRDIDGDDDDDLTYACLQDYEVVEWKNRDSDTVEFEPETTFREDAGQAADVFLHGDVTGNGNADLIIGRIVSSAVVEWRVRESDGTQFGSSSLWSSDGGNAGDVFRLGDVDGDGVLDLIAARPVDPIAFFGWSVEVFESTGGSFSSPNAVILSLADELVMDWLVADATGDGQDDLIGVHREAAQTVAQVFASTGSNFNHLDGTIFNPTFGDIEYVHAGDTNGDGLADLIFGDVLNDTTVDWHVSVRSPVCIPGLGVPCYLGVTDWRLNGSNAGDETHVGDVDGDGLVDLIYGRAVGQDDLVVGPDLDPLKWRARLSTGSAFGTTNVWAEDAGGDGWLFP